MLPDARPRSASSVPTERLTATARPAPAFRDELRRIPNVRNALAVASVYVADDRHHRGRGVDRQPLRVGRSRSCSWAARTRSSPRSCTRPRTGCCSATASVNDWVGRWLLGFPSFTPIDLYRRGHMAHHRDEFGPDEPDIPLYRGYPIARDSLRRKLDRDATGPHRLEAVQGPRCAACASDDAAVRSQARSIVGTQLVLIAVGVALGHPWVYFLLWFAPYLTVWRVINRLRSIAEHGGMQRSKDRRLTTHTVRQSLVGPLHRSCRIHIGWHLAHHVDSGVPMAQPPEAARRARAAPAT